MDEIDEMGEIGLHFALLACATSLQNFRFLACLEVARLFRLARLAN